MQIILLSGGSGRRLWPLSNKVRSKQFLKVIQNENGGVESMLQRVYRQMKTAKLAAEITIATSASQVESIRGQLGEKVSIVVEPERRNTFPAIALTASYLYFEKNCPLDETIVVLPVDPYVEEEYFQMIHKLDKSIQTNAADIILMGVKPTYPSEKYGYIIPAFPENMEEGFYLMGGIQENWEKMKNNVLPVIEFKEKPDICMAQEFINRGGLWNCGVFAFRLSYLIKIVQAAVVCNCYADVEHQYACLERTSFDYAVVEKAKSVAVVTYSGEWKDLGTWNTLTEVMEEKPIGDVAVSEECENTYVINELDIPMVVMGAKNMIVAASPDGILVSDKEQSSYIKKYVEERDLRPMFEERSWGEYKVLDMVNSEDGTKSLTKHKKVRQSERIEYQVHQNRAEVWTVLSGKCIITINDCVHEASAGDTYSIPEGVKHGLLAVTDTEIIEIQVGKELMRDGTKMLGERTEKEKEKETRKIGKI